MRFISFLGIILISFLDGALCSTTIHLGLHCIDYDICFDITCDVEVSDLPSAYVPQRIIHVTLESFAADCSGPWGITDERMNEQLDVSISGTISVDVLVNGTTEWPTNLVSAPSDCQLTDPGVDVHIRTGPRSIDHQLIDEIIDTYITKLLTEQLCPDLSNFVQVNGTEWIIQDLDPAMASVMASAPAPGHSNDCANCIVWASSPALEVANLILDGFFRTAPSVLVVQMQNSSILNTTIPRTNTSLFILPTAIKIYGLDTAFGRPWLKPKGEGSLSIDVNLAFRHLKFVIETSVWENTTTQTPPAQLNLTIGARPTRLNATVYVAVDPSQLSQLYLDQLLTDCTLQAVEGVNVTSLLLDTHLTEVDVETNLGGIAGDSVKLVDNLLELLLEGYAPLVHDLAAGIAQGPLRSSVNERLAEGLQNSSCPSHVPTDKMNLIKWSDSRFVSFFNTVFNNGLGAAGINTLVDIFTEGSGKVVVDKVTIGGLDTFTEFYAFAPEAAHPFNLNFSFALEELEMEWHSAINVGHHRKDTSVYLTHPSMELDLLLGVDKSEIGNLQVYQLGTPFCLMSTVYNISIDELYVSTQKLTVKTPQGTTNKENIAIEPELVHVNDLMGVVIGDSKSLCTDGIPGVDSSSDDDDTIHIDAATGTMIGAMLVFFLLAIVMNWGSITNVYSWCASGKACTTKYDWDNSIFNSPAISNTTRIAMPFLFLANIALFLVSNQTDGAVVEMKIDVGDRSYTPDPLFTFGLANSVQDMWDAQVYALAILVAVFSAAWPYIKLLVMLACWFAPLEIIGADMKTWLLHWLDALGKWSLMDTFVMVLFMVSFAFDLDISDELSIHVTVKPGIGFYTFLYGTIASLFLGHASMYMWKQVQQSRRLGVAGKSEVVRSDCDEDVIESRKSVYHALEKPLMFHTFTSMRGTVHEQRYRFTALSNILMCLGILCCLVFVCIGCYEQTVEFKFKGLLGATLDITNPDEVHAEYSMLDIYRVLPEKCNMEHNQDIVSIQYSFLFFALGMPVVFTVLLLVAWCAPLPRSFQKPLVALVNIAQAWSATEVLTVALGAAMLEIQQFAQFIIGSHCDKLNNLLEEYGGSRLDGDDVCFDVVAILLEPMWTLGLALVLLLFFCIPLTRLIEDALEPKVVSDLPQETLKKSPSLDEHARLLKSDLDAPLLSDADYDDDDSRLSLTLGARIIKYGKTSNLFFTEVNDDGDMESIIYQPPEMST